ncbi:hypothetical protein EV126DRAFT_165511 [Verticillium dahliae]|nr:hypothetical protein EV126DRAFT_165511 [Verticillium dahliae]
MERMQRRLCRCRCLSLDTTHRRLRSLPEFTDEPCSSGVHVASRTPSRLLTLVQTQAKRSFGILRLLLAISSTPAPTPNNSSLLSIRHEWLRGRAHSLQSLPPGLRWLATSQCRGVSFAQSKKGGSVCQPSKSLNHMSVFQQSSHSLVENKDSPATGF